MKTQPLETPKKNMIVFNGSLMAKITSDDSYPDNFSFYVLNGGWNGTYRTGEITVHRKGWTTPSEPFEQVVEITESERDRWYCDEPLSGHTHPVNQGEIPY